MDPSLSLNVFSCVESRNLFKIIICFLFSDISESIRNLRVEITCRNDKRKTQKKVQFNTRNNNSICDMRIQVDKEKAGFPHPHNKNGQDRNLTIGFNGSECESNFKKNGCGMLVEKPLDRPSLSKEQTRKIVVSLEYNKSRRDIQYYEEELNSKAKVTHRIQNSLQVFPYILPNNCIHIKIGISYQWFFVSQCRYFLELHKQEKMFPQCNTTSN